MTQAQLGLAAAVDRVMAGLMDKGGLEVLAATTPTVSADFKMLMTISRNTELEELCEQFPGLKRYAEILSSMAKHLHENR